MFCKKIFFLGLLIAFLFLLVPAAESNDLVIDLGNNVKMEFIKIPAGSFLMGSPPEEAKENILLGAPQHEVKLTKGFFMSKYPITQAQWLAIMKSWTKSNQPSAEIGAGDNFPVVGVSWYDAIKFCVALNEFQKLPSPYKAFYIENEALETVADLLTWDFSNGKYLGWNWEKTSNSFRLPTEAEYEYATRAGSNSAYFWGDKGNPDYAWMQENSNGKLNPVGTRLPNSFGLYDMVGLIDEWCWDEYADYPASSGMRIDPVGKGGSERVVRGGSFRSKWIACQSAHRFKFKPDTTSFPTGMGFRIVKPID